MMMSWMIEPKLSLSFHLIVPPVPSWVCRSITGLLKCVLLSSPIISHPGSNVQLPSVRLSNCSGILNKACSPTYPPPATHTTAWLPPPTVQCRF